MRYRVLAIGFLFFMSTGFCAEIISSGCKSKLCVIHVFGKIDSQLVSEIQSLIDSKYRPKLNSGVIIQLYSFGGDVQAALEIGKIARKSQAIVSIPKNSVCMSSCVFILAGGVSRIIEGEVGIHAPYFPNEYNDSYSSSKNNFLILEGEIKKYLNEMNVDEDLYDDMLHIPSSDIKILSHDDLVEYGLYGEDPFYRESTEIRQAEKLGISREELMRRQQIKKEICHPIAISGDILGWAECADKVMGYERQLEQEKASDIDSVEKENPFAKYLKDLPPQEQ